MIVFQTRATWMVSHTSIWRCKVPLCFPFLLTPIYRNMLRRFSGRVAGSFRRWSSSRRELHGWSPILVGHWRPLHSGPEELQWRGEMEMSIRKDWLLQRTMETQTDELCRWGIDADAAKTCEKRPCSLGSDLENNQQPWQHRCSRGIPHLLYETDWDAPRLALGSNFWMFGCLGIPLF